MKDFSMIRLNHDGNNIFGDLEDAVNRAEKLKKEAMENSIRIFEEEMEKSESTLIDLFGSGFDGSLDFLEESLKANEDMESEQKLTAAEAVKFTQDEVEERFLDRTLVGGGFNAFKDEFKGLSPEERALKIGMEVSESRAINDPDSKEYREDHNTSTLFNKNYGSSNTKTSSYNNSYKNKNNNNNSNSSYGSSSENKGNMTAREKYDKFFGTFIKSAAQSGAQRINAWRKDIEQEKKEVDFLNRYETSKLKKQINKMKVFIKTKRFKITMKMAGLLSLNLAMGIITKQVQIENFSQIFALLSISLTTFYLTRELTEDGVDLRGLI